MAQNPLFNLLQGNPQASMQNGILGRFRAFQSQFKGDPRQTIQQMLNSGRITQAQYNDAVQKANTLMQMLGGK